MTTPPTGRITVLRAPAGAHLFGWVRLRIWRASLRELLQAPVKLGVILSMWTILFVALYVLAYEGIRFVFDTAGLGPFLLSRLWFLFLFVVMVLLAVSQIASAYSTLVRTPETRAWMVLPVSARTLCRAKWLESSIYSSWAVIALVVPLGLAYLVVLKQPLWLIGWAIGILLIPLAGIVTAVATMGLLVWLRWLGRLVIRRELVPVGFVVACGLLFWILGEQGRDNPRDAWFVALQALLPRMQIAMAWWWPSSWMATALDAGLNTRWVESGLYAILLWMTMLGCWRLLDHLAARLLFPVLRQHAQPLTLSSGEGAARRSAIGPPVAVPLRVHWWMRQPWRALLAKDLFLVSRDPLQWSQALVFFGLLGAYFANIHKLASFSGEPSWRIGIACLNLACTLLVFGSLAVRFLFPQMSVEGRSLWMLRVAPDGMRLLLYSKVWFYGVLAVAINEGLLMLSASRLGVPLPIRWWLALVGVVSALAVVGLTVGLGAWWIDLTAQDAAQVVSSANGAMALVLMLGYVGCVVAALVAAWASWRASSEYGLFLVSIGLVVVSVMAGGLPLYGGLAKLERLELSG